MANTFAQKYIIESRYLGTPSKRRSGLHVSPGVKFVVAHDTGNPGSTAAGNVAYYERTRDADNASAHIFVDDRQIIECIPALTAPPEKAKHVLLRVDADNRMYGYNANDAAIGVEYCFGGKIDADEAYRKYVWVIANICQRFGLDPATAIVGHAFLDPQRKTDPGYGLGFSRRSYDQLLRDIPVEYAACLAAAGAQPPAYQFTQQVGSVQAAAKLNLRKGAPNRMADVVQTVPAGTRLDYAGWVSDGELLNGNSKWYRDARGNYFWSGATVA